MGDATGHDILSAAEWLNPSAILSALALLVAVAGLIWPSWSKSLAEQLDNPADRAGIKRALSAASGFERYQAWIGRWTARFDRWFGPPGGYRAFDVCVRLALFYPIGLFLLAWLLGGPGELGRVEIFPAIDEFPARLWRAALLVALSLCAYFFFANLEKIIQWIDRSIRRLFGISQESTAPITGVIGAVAVAVAAAAAVAIAVAVAAAAAVAAATAGAVAVAAAAAVSSIVFYVLFPLINAALDWLSWRATRYFLSKAKGLKGRDALFWLLADLTFDLVIAFGCLVLLVVALPNVLEMSNLIFAWLGWPAITWIAQLEQALAYPFTRGLMVTGMLCTTLLPTFIHLVACTGGVFFSCIPQARQAAALIPDGDGSFPAGRDKQRVIRTLMLGRLAWAPAAFVVTGFLAFIVWLFQTAGWPLGQGLANIALCSTAWSHGTCVLF
ncbi:MAG: hypothetical protein AAF441_20790 [Pseudomonadota bacterium]